MKATYLPQVASGELHVSFGVTEPDAGTDTTNISTRATQGRRRLAHPRPQDLEHQGAHRREVPAARPHHAARGGAQAHRRDDAVPRRHAGAGGRRSRRSPSSDATPSRRARCRSTTCSSPTTTSSARSAAASTTCSTASTPSASCSPPRRSASDGRRSGGPSPTPTSGSCSAGRSARTRASPSRSPTPTCGCGPPRLMIRDASARYDAGLPCGEQANSAKYLAADAAYDAADRARADPRRDGLRHRVRRRALLARGPPDPHRPDLPGDGPQLRRRARPRPAPLVLTARPPIPGRRRPCSPDLRRTAVDPVRARTFRHPVDSVRARRRLPASHPAVRWASLHPPSRTRPRHRPRTHPIRRSLGRHVDRGFRPDIEGLRAVAVIAVVVYHARLVGLHGGFIGVDVFFVVSGFLITRLILGEMARTGRLVARRHSGVAGPAACWLPRPSSSSPPRSARTSCCRRSPSARS